MKVNKARQTAIVAIFFAIMLIIQLLSNLVFSVWPIPTKPTLVQIPVIIAAILYGPKIGASLGILMGLMSLVTNSIIILPTSYLFSPFVEQGNIFSLVIALIPRLLIGILPYYTAKWFSGKLSLAISGIVGSLTNTVFVLLGIFIFFSDVYGGSIQALLGAVMSTNALAEMVISAILVTTMIPRLKRSKK
ncbi:membrane protein [Streptococcus agalactiae LMG 14747]|uniref:Membrane protein n=1 Tax=Streptococcus agalactiae LMG 14747 TaxID=1154860 RepID=V6Z2K8_STRAG|nr:membrane protein [Streptococcus agalactiae LMG 14747]